MEEAKDTVISTIEAASALRVEGYSSQRALFTKKIRIVRGMGQRRTRVEVESPSQHKAGTGSEHSGHDGKQATTVDIRMPRFFDHSQRHVLGAQGAHRSSYRVEQPLKIDCCCQQVLSYGHYSQDEAGRRADT